MKCTQSKEKDFLSIHERRWLNEHKNDLSLAPDPSYAPFEFYDTELGRTVGLANDYIKLIERKLGIKFNIITTTTFDESLTLAKIKKIAIVNAVTSTPERLEYLTFTEPYVEIKNIIIVKKNLKEKLSINDLKGKKISVIRGYAVTEYLLKKYPSLNYDIVPGDLQALFNVADGQSDAAIMDIASSSYLTDKIGIANLRFAGEIEYTNKLAIGSRKDWPELNSILNKTLARITVYERDEIKHKWISFEEPDILKNKTFWLIIIALLTFFLVIGGVILLWNRILKNQVYERTRDLSAALKRKQQVEDEIKSKNKILEAQNEVFEKINNELISANNDLFKSEANLNKSLREKETLIREVYHRTKNTMQVIRGMLVLHSGNFPDNKEVQQLVEDTELRIQAMSLVHQMLYRSNDLSRISIKEYVHELAYLLIKSFGVSDGKISLDIKIDDRNFLIDTAIPLGLLLNELISNSLKYAFPGDRAGRIVITLTRGDEDFNILNYSDNGVGVTSGFKYRDQETLGMQLIFGIAEEQMQGTVIFENDEGIKCFIKFPEQLYKERI